MPRNIGTARRTRRIKNIRRKGFRRRTGGLDLDYLRKEVKADGRR